MQRSRFARIGFLVALAIGWILGGSAPAHAQMVPIDSLASQAASSAMLDSLKSKKLHVDAATAPAATASDAPLPPISDSDQTKAQFLPPTIDYQFKVGPNFAEGSTGAIRHALQMSVDGGVIVKIEPRTRIAAAYYQLSTNIIGVDTGTIPIQVQNSKAIITQENLQSYQPDASTKIEVYVFAVERLFTIKNSPLVATFAYDTQDALTYAGGAPRRPVLTYLDGRVEKVYLGTVQHYNLIFSEPFVLNDQKLFIVFSQQIQQMVHNQNFNATPNRPQLLYSAFFQYDINDKASFFFEPAKNVSEHGQDRYPQHQATFLYGVAYKLKKPFFLQASVTNIATTNPDYDGTGRIGITRVTIACPPNTTGGTGLSAACKNNLLNQTTIPTFGGTKLATINLSIGIGTPPVYIPF